MTRAIVKGFKKLIIVPRDPASFTRSSTAYNPETGEQVGVNEPRFVAGPFPGSRALLVEEGTTNILSAENASFEGGTVGNWSPILATRSVVDTAWHGTKGLLVSPTSSNGRVQLRIDPGGLNLVALNDTITFSAYARLASGDPGNVTVRIVVDGVAFKVSTAQVTSTGWTRISVTHTLDTFGTGVYVQLFGGEFGASYRDVIFDGIQLEKKPYATSFHPGTRSPETLTIPTAGVLSPQEGTIECYLPAGRRMYGTDLQFIVDIGGTDVSGGCIYIGPDGLISALFGDGSNTYSTTHPTVLDPNQTYYVGLGWQAGMFDITVNDVTKEKPAPHNFTPYANAYIGCHTGIRRWLDGPIGDLRISSIYRTPAERLAAYQSGKPLPVDEWTTLKVPFDASLAGYGLGYVYVPSNKTRVVGGPRRTKAVLLSRS